MRKILLFIVAIVLLLSYASIFIVNEGQCGIIFRFGKLISNNNSGLHIKIPFWDKLKIIDTRIQSMENLIYSCKTIEYQKIIIDLYIKWRISDLSRYYLATYGNISQAAEVLMKCKFSDILNAKLIIFDVKEILKLFNKTIIIDIREALNNGTSDDVIHMQYTATDNAIASVVDSLELENKFFNHNSMAALGIQVLDIGIKKINLKK